jgi:transcriptional regulator with PAS, ATPase and Fis domain
MKLVGQSPLFLAATRSLTRLARFEVPVLIEGETGTGKELAARVVHYQSERRRGPFIPVNCGALPDTLVENEFFGHERGAYTDARESMPGVVALAEGGTLFLDEVNALPAKAQAALLRFLQDQRYRPLGAPGERSANVRIVAATNKNLEQLVERGEFRSDLFFRIKILFVNLPPLRVRHGDATLLAEHFLDECARRFHQPRKRLGPATRTAFESYSWPGNVRELENLIVRDYLMSDCPELVWTSAPSPAPEPLTSYAAAKAAAVADFDRRFLRELLTRAAGNVTRAAAEAGKERRALGRLVKKYGLRSHDFKR